MVCLLLGENSFSGCADTDNCNNPQGFPKPPPPANLTSIPITCYEGMLVNNNPIANNRYVTCNGNCFSATFATSVGGQSINATVLTCDPASVCQNLNITNTCAAIDGGILNGCW